MSPNKNKMIYSFNYSAIIKIILILLAIIFGMIFQFPAYNIAKQWIQEADYHAHDNTTWVNMTGKQQMAFLMIPGFYFGPMIAYYYIVFRARRKSLVINGQYEGKILFIYGLNVNSHFYDFYSIFKGFRHYNWDEFPLPISGNEYKGKIVIYVRLSILDSPLTLQRIVVEDKSQIRIGIYKLWVSGTYDRLIRNHMNPILSYRVITNKLPYNYEEQNLEDFKKYHQQSIERIRRDNVEMQLGNPALTADMIRDSMYFISEDLELEMFDLMPKEDQERLTIDLRKAPGNSQ